MEFENIEEPQRYGDPAPKPGQLLGEDKGKVAKRALAIWESKAEAQKRREAQWEVNEKRRAGIKCVQLQAVADDRSWIAYVPRHLQSCPDAINVTNKAATLCRKFVSIMFADPPAPDAVPFTGEDEDREAAEFSTRVLLDLQSSKKLNEPKKGRKAFDKGSTFGSGFIHYRVDSAADRMPLQIFASPSADHVRNALVDDEGRDWPDVTERYVTEDGTLTDEVKDAALRNVPGLVSEVLTGRNVRFIPGEAEDIEDAYGAQVASFVPWGKLKRDYPELADLGEDGRKKLFSFRPKFEERLVTPQQKRLLKRRPDDEDETLVFCLTTYYKQGPEYADGALVVTVGNSETVVQDKWSFDDDFGHHSLPIPISQWKQWAEGQDDPYGHGAMSIVGPGNEARASMIAAKRDHIGKLLKRKVFVPMHSTLQKHHLEQPGGSLIKILPGTEPKYEEIPSFPRDGNDDLRFTTEEMENDLGLPGVAQGLESPQVQSGRHAQAIVSQVHSGLSEIRQNIIDGYLRGCEIQLALVRAFYDAPVRIGWVGEDGAYKERRWSGSDLRQTADVQLKDGTLTMLSPVAKAQLAEHFMEFGIIDQQELKEITSSNIGGMVGVRDDPFLMRVRRQIFQWLQGPPEGWQPQFQPQMQVVMDEMGQPMMNPDGQPQMQAVMDENGQPAQEQVMDEALMGVFRQIPADDEPYVALTRLREISKTMSKTDYSLQPPEWQWGLDQEFVRAKMASEMTPGAPDVGQPPGQQRSPAQRTEGPLAQPETPLPEDTGPSQIL